MNKLARIEAFESANGKLTPETSSLVNFTKECCSNCLFSEKFLNKDKKPLPDYYTLVRCEHPQVGSLQSATSDPCNNYEY